MAQISTVFLFALVAAASAGYLGHYEHEDYNHHPEYKYEYSVHDPHTHDIKSQHETRHGDVVKGYYKLKEADGTVREVHYTADHKNGFNAEVHRSGHASHPEHYKSSSETFYGHGSHGHASSSNNNNLYSHGYGYSSGGYGHGHAYSTNNNNLYSRGHGYSSGYGISGGHGHAYSTNNNNLYSSGKGGYGHAYSTNNNNLYNHGHGYSTGYGLSGGYGLSHATSSAYFKSH